MNTRPRLQNRQGFTIIETVMAVAILSLVCMTGSQLLLRITQHASQASMSKKAATLGEMVLEKASSVSLQDYTLLSSLNGTNQSAMDFFHTADNMG
jgi:prepilin-type N-terminal cleavage/methylation domain-containing protein